jgi:uncharacterized membrane protein HdeD (DUF308 family)
VSGPTTSATPESAAAPSAPPVADGELQKSERHSLRQPRWRIVGLVALGLLIVFYGILVISLGPAALAGVAVLALIAGGIAQIALAGGLGRRWLGYVGGLVGVAAGVVAFAWPALTLAVLTAWSLVVDGVVRIVGSVADPTASCGGWACWPVPSN